MVVVKFTEVFFNVALNLSKQAPIYLVVNYEFSFNGIQFYIYFFLMISNLFSTSFLVKILVFKF